MKQKDKQKNKILSKTIFVLLLVLFIGIATYPFITDQLLSQKQQGEISKYERKTRKMSAKKFMAYLEELQGKESLKADGDPFANSKKKDKSTVNIAQSELNTVAILSIPKIKLQLPVFDTVDELSLNNGAGLLNGASDLSGNGNGKNLVILGHSGLSIAKLFTNLPRLRIGDKFYLKINGKIRAYKVDSLRTVKPEQMLSYLQATKSKNYATLVTCVPLFVNDHRLLVRGHRVPYHKEKLVSNGLSPLAWALIITAGIVLVTLLLYLRKRSKRQKRGGGEAENG